MRRQVSDTWKHGILQQHVKFFTHQLKQRSNIAQLDTKVKDLMLLMFPVLLPFYCDINLTPEKKLVYWQMKMSQWVFLMGSPAFEKQVCTRRE